MSTTGWDLALGRTRERDERVSDVIAEMRLEIGKASLHLRQGAYVDAVHDIDAASSACDELSRRLSDEVQGDASSEIVVQTLGVFRVLRAGSPITSSDWQSRKARTLLKILISRYGGPVNREVLMEILWPDEEPTKSSSRLSVALSTLRSVLCPHKTHESDYVVAADRTSVWLRSEHVRIDLVGFMSSARRGLQSRRRGDGVAATRCLESAERLYRGGFMEEDAYESWVVGPREEARATYVEVLFALAEDVLDDDGRPAAMRRYREILEMDPYDERAHLGLVRTLACSGHHGEARRCHRSYVARMREIGRLDVVPFPVSEGAP